MESEPTVQALTVITANEIVGHEIPAFRGAVCRAAEVMDCDLFHNHVEGGLRYSYPKIQYKMFRGNAAMFAISEGVGALEALLTNHFITLNISGRSECLVVAEAYKEDCDLRLQDQMYRHHIRQWLPFNKENNQRYRQTESFIERLQLLQRVLTGNILSLLKGLGVFVEGEVRCEILDMTENRPVAFKKVKMRSFDLEFQVNMRLPQMAGLGHGVSLGFGTLTRKE